MKSTRKDSKALLDEPVQLSSNNEIKAQDKVGEEYGDVKADFTRLLRQEQLQQLFTDFCESVVVEAAIIDLDGNVLIGSRWQRCCTDFHRVNEDSCANCLESDTDLALNLNEGKDFVIYHCKNGMTDCASPIIIDDHHVANVFIGQFHLEQPNLLFFSEQAEHYGFDVSDYVSAIQDA